jgi:hypothetical protein
VQRLGNGVALEWLYRGFFNRPRFSRHSPDSGNSVFQTLLASGSIGGEGCICKRLATHTSSQPHPKVLSDVECSACGVCESLLQGLMEALYQQVDFLGLNKQRWQETHHRAMAPPPPVLG